MTLMNGFRWSKTEEYFRENYTHVSDPAPKAEPSALPRKPHALVILGPDRREEAEPPDPEVRVHLETGISRVGGKLRCEPEECHKYQTFLMRERDIAVARVKELEAENARLKQALEDAT